jgi:TorA maturation chaperone TorD
MTASPAVARQSVNAHDLQRSEHYRFVSRLLSAAPSVELLQLIREIRGDETPLGQAYNALALAAADTDAQAVEREYFELFVGVGRGELLPYASFYLTGFLNERPLAELRGDLARLGIARAAGRHEPEDHIALLFEVMADMAVGEIDAGIERQAEFYNRHIAPWATQFFEDLAIAPSARFYRPVSEIGQLVIEIETRAFALQG